MRLKSAEFTAGQFYHIYNRATGNELLFRDNTDYLKCISLLKQYYHPEHFAFLAYCLMPNHYHILLHQISDYDFSKCFGSVWYRFSAYYNKKHNRKGVLYAGKMQHIGIRDEKYLFNLCAYIHLNPVKASLVDKAEDWEWSNLMDWLQIRNGIMVDREIIDAYFPDSFGYLHALHDLADGLTDKKMLLDNQ